MSTRPMRGLSRGLLGTTAVLAAGLSGLYLKPASLKPSSVLPFLRSASSTSTTPPFTYRLAAAASGKRSPPRPAKINRDFWLYSSASPNFTPPYIRSSKPDSGEDSFFMATVGGSPHNIAFGVADGVGGWQDQGVDPSVFSHALSGLMAGTAYIHEGLEEGKTIQPRDLMQTAYDAVIANPRIVAGGCTASIGIANGDGELETANLGDSGFLILSPSKISARSEPQTHAFNTPYQMAKVPAKIKAQNAIFGGSQHFSETPAQADVQTWKLAHGDVVVFGTDGVWDNLSAQDTLSIVSKIMEQGGYWTKSGGSQAGSSEMQLNSTLVSDIPAEIKKGDEEVYLPGLLAAAVMREAKVAGLDRKRNGPFAKEVQKFYPGEHWEGGKEDDIAVVVAVAVKSPGQEKPIKAKL